MGNYTKLSFSKVTWQFSDCSKVTHPHNVSYAQHCSGLLSASFNSNIGTLIIQAYVLFEPDFLNTNFVVELYRDLL